MILGQKVEILDNFPLPEDILGDSDIDTRCIRLSSKLTKQQYNRVLAHEIMHMIVGLAGRWLTDDQEESLCILMENCYKVFNNIEKEK